VLRGVGKGGQDEMAVGLLLQCACAACIYSSLNPPLGLTASSLQPMVLSTHKSRGPVQQRSSINPNPNPSQPKHRTPSPPPAQTRAASEGTRKMAEETLDQIEKLGFTVIRVWAFNDGPGWNALQTGPGALHLLMGAGCRGGVSGGGGSCLVGGRSRGVGGTRG